MPALEAVGGRSEKTPGVVEARGGIASMNGRRESNDSLKASKKISRAIASLSDRRALVKN